MVLSLERWIGKTAVVTGASSGIGAEVVKKLVQAGIKVAGLARSQELMADLAKQLENEEGEFYPIVTDMRKEEDILKAFEIVKSKLGPIHILVNSAGVVKRDLLIEGKTEDWTETFQVNVIGLAIATREAIKDMRENNLNGHIIHINSVVGHCVKNIKHSLYPASKHAVTAMTEIQRRELTNLKIKIKTTSLSPGLVNTRILSPEFRNSENFQKEFIDKQLILEPEDVAEAVMYALSTPPHVEIAELTIKPVGEYLGD